MFKGLLAGGFGGAVIGGASLTVASLASEQPAGNSPPVVPQVSAPQAVQADAAAGTAPQDVPPTMIAPDVESISTPTVSAPTVETNPQLADTASADVPQTSGVSDTFTAPKSTPAMNIDVTAEDPVLPNPQSIASQVPANEQDITVSTTPAALPELVLVADEAPVLSSPLDIPVPQPRHTDVVVIETPLVEQVPEEPLEDSAAASSSTLPAGDSRVQVNRITTEDSAITVTDATPTVDLDAPALVQYGTIFDNVDNRPLMGIILMDDGSMSGASAAVASLPFDVTVVLDPTTDGAIERLATYRAAGIEVGVQSALPVNATPTDVEIALEATFATLPETVLLLDAGDGGLQNDRAVTEQAMERLAEDGRGIVVVSKGLNMALRAAEQLDVPAGVIFWDLDGQDQDARVIRRFLDQAAFRARQESGVLLLARVRPNTISALVLWGTANRAGQVAVAPVSAVLSGQD